MSLRRYSATKKNNIDQYLTTRYPKFPKSMSDKYIISREQDRLDQLANTFYGDPRYWWILATANPELEKWTLLVAPGIQLRIPDVNVDTVDGLLEREENIR